MFRSSAEFVQCASVTPGGIGALNVLMVKLVPTPSTKSVLSRKWDTINVPVWPPVPRARRWSSGNALLPASVVITGMLVSSASSTRSSVASAYRTPCPALITGRDASSRPAARSRTSSGSAPDRCGLTGS